jgi:hypothetical protein
MAASAAERERHAAIVARIEQMGLAEVASPMSGPSAVPENIVSPRNRVLANSFAQAPRPDQDFLISSCCIDILSRHGVIDHPILTEGEIEHPNPHEIGSRNLMEQLAPRKNAKAPRSVFVGSPTMEMDE